MINSLSFYLCLFTITAQGKADLIPTYNYKETEQELYINNISANESDIPNFSSVSNNINAISNSIITSSIEPEISIKPTSMIKNKNSPDLNYRVYNRAYETSRSISNFSSSLSTSVSSSSTINSDSAYSSDESSASSTGRSLYTGDGTYYNPALGACGMTNSDSDHIVAISKKLFDTKDTGNPNNNPFCKQKIKVYYGSKSVSVTVVDRCVGCEKHDLDLSPSAFKKLADESLGRITISWSWEGKSTGSGASTLRARFFHDLWLSISSFILMFVL